MEMLKVIDDLIQIGKDKGLKVVPEILLVISFTVLFFSPACLFFILYKRGFFINIEYTIILILILSGMLFLTFYFLTSIIVPFSGFVRYWRTKRSKEIDIKNCKVYTFIITMLIFFTLSTILIIGYLAKRINEFCGITQYGIRLIIISITIIGGVLLILWGTLGLINIIVQIKNFILNKRTKKIKSKDSKTFGKMPDIKTN